MELLFDKLLVILVGLLCFCYVFYLVLKPKFRAFVIFDIILFFLCVFFLISRIWGLLDSGQLGNMLWTINPLTEDLNGSIKFFSSLPWVLLRINDGFYHFQSIILIILCSLLLTDFVFWENKLRTLKELLFVSDAIIIAAFSCLTFIRAMNLVLFQAIDGFSVSNNTFLGLVEVALPLAMLLPKMTGKVAGIRAGGMVFVWAVLQIFIHNSFWSSLLVLEARTVEFYLATVFCLLLIIVPLFKLKSSDSASNEQIDNFNVKRISRVNPHKTLNTQDKRNYLRGGWRDFQK